MVKKITKTIKKREMKQPCNLKCRMKCQEKFHGNSRIQIFNDFYSCADKSIQSQQLATLVSEHETTRKRGADPSNSRRNMSREYHLVKKGEKIRVCQKMFLNTFAIDEKHQYLMAKGDTVIITTWRKEQVM